MLYGIQEEIFVRSAVFTIFSGFITVSLTTLGAFGLTDPKNYTKENLSALAHSATLGAVGAKKDGGE